MILQTMRVDIFNPIKYDLAMEKRKPHYPLSRVQMLIREGAYTVTRTALRSASHDFGFIEASQLAACVLAMEVGDFYKSMTTIHNSTLWQDVYTPTIREVKAYVKVQVVEAATVVISFKTLEGEKNA